MSNVFIYDDIILLFVVVTMIILSYVIFIIIAIAFYPMQSRTLRTLPTYVEVSLACTHSRLTLVCTHRLACAIAQYPLLCTLGTSLGRMRVMPGVSPQRNVKFAVCTCSGPTYVNLSFDFLLVNDLLVFYIYMLFVESGLSWLRLIW